jgi:hypothetical protein
MYKFLKFFLLAVIAIAATLTACNKNDDTAVEDAVDQALYSAQERGGLGKYGCYELIFPATIVLPDSSTVEVNSYEEIKTALRTYFQSQGTGGNGHHHHNRPKLSFVYPISVLSQDGEVITVETQEELIELRVACAGATFGQHGHGGHGQHGLSCFDIVFPVTIQFPDSTTATANSRQEMRQLTREWRQNNPGVQGRTQVVFPITVKMTDDSTLVTVNSREELKQLKEDCE